MNVDGYNLRFSGTLVLDALRTLFHPGAPVREGAPEEPGDGGERELHLPVRPGLHGVLPPQQVQRGPARPEVLLRQ